MHGTRRISRLVAVAALLVLLPIHSLAAAGSEHALANEIVAGLRDGTVEWMSADGDRFPVIVREAEREEAAGVLLIVPEPGANADWPDVVRPLRLGLAKAGWQTVALQMPLAGEDGDYRDRLRAAGRLRFAIESLVAGGVVRLVVLAQGRAYRTVVEYLETLPDGSPAQLHGLVLISPALPEPASGGVVADPLVAATMPMLEVSGSEDGEDVRRLVTEHARLASRGAFPARRALVIDGADRAYRAQSDLLVRRVRGWVGTLPLVEKTAP